LQTVSSSWAPNLLLPARTVQFSSQLSFPLTVVTSNFFTIGTSLIGGPDIIKSGGTATAFFDKFQYTDYSSLLISVDVSQKVAQYPYGIIMAQADVKLSNATNLFTPNYDPTIGQYIKAGRPFKWSMGIDGEVLQQFVGFTTNPQLDQSLQEKALSYQAYDAFNYIATYQSSTTAVQVNQPAQNIIAAGMAEMGFSSSQYVLDQSLQPNIGVIAPYGYYWGDIFNDLCQAEQALMFIDENGIIHFWNRQHFLTTGSAVWQIDNTVIESLVSEDTPIFNDVEVVANPRTIAADKDVWDLGTAQILNPGANVVEADFSDDDGPMPVSTLDTLAAYQSATTSSYTVNTASDGSGSDQTATVTISSVVNYGTTALITVTNPTTGTLWLTAMTLWGTPGEVTTPISIRYTDQTSVDEYGENPGNNGEVLQLQAQDVDVIQNVSTANSLAYTIVHEFKDGRQRYNATVLANPAIQLGDVIEILQEDGYCLSLNGLSTTYVDGGTGSIFEAASALTVFIWVNPTSVSVGSVVVKGNQGYGDNYNYHLEFQGTNLFYGTCTSTTEHYDSYSGFPFDGKWHSIGLTADGTTAILYVDGVQVKSTNGTGPYATYSGSHLLLGARPVYAGSSYQGYMDTFSFWKNTALQQSDMTLLQQGKPASILPTVQWLFNEAAGTTAIDSMGAQNGTIAGATYYPQGAYGIKTMYVTGRTLSLGVGDLTHQLELEERLIESYFTIGTSLIGSTDGIAP
jgi:hypothetical protein